MERSSILFVDDEPWFTEPMRMTLEARGFICEVRREATSAWLYLVSHPVSALVTDIMMPAGEEFENVDSSETGYVFIDRVRQKFPRLSIICLSVIGDQKKINALKRKGVQYLRKGETPLNAAVRLVESKATGLYRSL
jgi:DNA-binding NarL/FixJ family response regulator